MDEIKGPPFQRGSKDRFCIQGVRQDSTWCCSPLAPALSRWRVIISTHSLSLTSGWSLHPGARSQLLGFLI